MKTEVVNKGSRQNVRPPDPKKPKSCTQPPAGNAITDRKDTQTAGLAELIRLYRNGSTKASLTLGDMFRPLLEKEAEKLVKANLATSPEDGLSLAILLFFEFLDVFRKTDVTDERIPSLLKKYLHDLRINKSYSTKRHCPDCYAVDFEKELADCTPFSKKFPCYEMETDDQLDARFRSRMLKKAIETLTEKEKAVITGIFTENKSPVQIAGELHCSTRYLRRLKSRALDKMRRYLEPYYPDLMEK